MIKSIYICPLTKESLYVHDDGLLRHDGTIYPFINTENNIRIPNFLITNEYDKAVKQSLEMYDQENSSEIYRNFLSWLFQTFNESELSFRTNLIEKLKLTGGNKVLVTGCGLGNDIPPILNIIGSDGEVYANDLAAQMVVSVSHHLMTHHPNSQSVFLSVCDAQILPFPSDFFDGAFHFGGINLFDNIKSAISEMERVVKPGGRVVFGDEGIAPWLRDTEYGRMAINNNLLWGRFAPIDLLPRNAVDVHLSWVLGNCFYVIDFEVSETGPSIDIDVSHKGCRGGSMRTRYFGQLEGVTEETKKYVIEDAQRKGISVHDWLEQVIREKQKQ